MGTADVEGTAVREHLKFKPVFPFDEYDFDPELVPDDEEGCCVWSYQDVIEHVAVDVGDSEDCDRYEEVQECLRMEGIPSGDRSGPPGGVPSKKFLRVYRNCMRIFGCY